jgi:hypothetical protein
MADKTYVCVAPVAVKEAFDNKYKSTLPKLIRDGLGDAVDRSSKLTTKPPADKTAEGFYVAGEVWLTKTDKGIEAEASVVLADWPKKKMFSNKDSKASADVPNPAKIDQKVNEVIGAILEHLQANVVKELEKRAQP